MTKSNVFYWAWNEYPAQPDSCNTRERAARLLRAWRRQSRSNANYRNVISVTRLAPHVYRAISSHGGEMGTMYCPGATT